MMKTYKKIQTTFLLPWFGFPFLFATLNCFSQSPATDCSTTPSEQVNVTASCVAVPWDIQAALGSPAPSTCTGETPSGEDGWGWFTATLDTTTVEYTNTNQDAVVYIFSGTCASLTEIACASDVAGNGTESITLPTTPGQQYIVRVVRLTGTSGFMNGEICVWAPVVHCTNGIQDADETGVDCGGVDCQPCMVCHNNMDCGTAQTVTLSGGADTVFSCFNDCNTGADPESWNFTGAGCTDINNSPTVYYTFTTTFSFIDIIVSSPDITDPQIVLMTDNCSGWYQCDVGSGGTASISQFRGLSGTTYSIMISSQSGETGVFNLCIYNYNDPSACNVSDSLIATPPADTTDGNVTGVYYPGQTVEFCYTINQYNKVNCQWLMGIVPVIGSGWDTTTFTITQMPASADGDGNWQWFYVTDNVVDYNTTGDTVNPFGGWFYLNDCMGCPPHLGDPDNGWGDGMCGGPCQCDPLGSGFTWTVCFELTVKATCTFGEDLTVGIKTYSDGEIGGYTEVACQVDMKAYPAIASPVMACSNCHTVSVTKTDVLCFGGTSGTATVTIDSLGTPPFTYSWSTAPVQTTTTATGLGAGTFYVTVTDNAGCSDVDTAIITQPSALNAAITGTNVSCFGGSDGSADLTPSGGTGSFTYSWSSGAVTQDISGVSANTYTITLTDANGCTDVDSVIITEPLDLSGTINGTNITCTGGNDGAADLTPSGGTLPYTFNWSNSAVTEDISGIPAGNYSVTLTDANGCADSATVILTEPSPLVAIIDSSNNVLCNGDSSASAFASASGGSPPFSYLWSNGNTSSGIQNQASGIYTVTVTDANNCTSTAGVTITEPVAISLAITDTNDASCGSSDGSAIVTPAGGVLPYTYLWDDPLSQTDSTVTGLSSGTFNVTVTDANSCTRTASVNISNLGAPTTSITDTADNLCYGDSAGLAVVTPAGGTPPYTYLWDDPLSQTDSSATGLPAGTFNVTVTDNSGCNAITSVIIDEPALLNILISSITDVACFGDSTGAMSATVTGGIPVYVYLWSNGDSDSVAAAVAAGSYTVTVSDANGCTDIASEIITQPPLFSFSITGISNITCNGDSNGSATIIPTGGVLSYTYQWSDPMAQTDSVGDNLPPGTFYVTVSDANGCSDVDSVSITEPSLLSVSIDSSTDVFCNGDSSGSAFASASGGPPPYIYLWSNGDNDSVAAAVGSGSYTVTVTDGNLCTAIASVTITEPPAISLTFSALSVSCNGNSDGSIDLTVGGGVITYTFNWSNSSVTEDINSLNGGTYTVTLTDSNLCQAVDSVVVSEPAVLLSSITATDVACYKDSDGVADLVLSGGTPPYTYLWSDGSVSQDLNLVAAGSYTVTVTDANGCANIDSTVITEPAEILPSVSPVNASCNGCTDGSADLTVTGGNPPYSFNWSNSATTEDISSLAAGTFYVTITDFNGCTVTDSVVITEPPLSCALTLVFTALDVACNGDSSGSITVAAAGGSLPYTYAWSNGDTNAVAVAVAVGSYTVTVTDNSGCTATDSVALTEPPAISLSTGSTNADCLANNGSAWVTATGGITPYSYLWDGSAGSQANDTAYNLGAGLYMVYVTDGNGCIDSVTATVGSGPGNLLAIIDSVKNISCNSGSDGEIYISVLTGTPPYVYSWSDGSVNEDLTGVDTGNYSVTVTDTSGCVLILGALLTQPAALSAATNSIDAACGQDNGSAWVIAAGGTMPYSYLWNMVPAQTNDTAISLFAGNYSVTVTDANSCTITAATSVNNLNGPVISDSVVNVSCFGADDGAIYITVTGGTPPYTYQWNPFVWPPVNLTPGNYSLTVTDSNSCLAVGTYLITEPPALVLSVDSAINASCSIANGFIYLSATGGTGTVQFSSDGINYQASGIFSGLAPGNYIVYARDENMCFASDTVAITGSGTPAISVYSLAHVSCFSGSTGSISIIAGGGSGIYQYSTDSGTTWQSSSTIGGLPAGIYTMIVKDSVNGCLSEVKTAAITQPSALGSVIITTDESCDYKDDGQVIARVTGGNPPYAFTWNPDAGIDSVITGLSAGDYFVTVIDYNSCLITDSATVLTIGQNCLIIPSSFSPNEDGVNETWVIRGLSGYPDVIVEIFNRWGSKIYTSPKGYSQTWDGTYEGKQVSSATYYYIITFGAGTEPLTGTITVVR
ncbi:MAG: gliding motility-associated C-terminal domain-containing protein [Bacteroidetes bacterium]|nr:gliding motility-associated C-terminal domain-containing protein [Bacteroidota bacterium]